MLLNVFEKIFAAKIRPDFSKKVVLNLKLPKNHFIKKFASRFNSSMKKIQKDLDDFDIENPLLALFEEAQLRGFEKRNTLPSGYWHVQPHRTYDFAYQFLIYFTLNYTM